jgi:hypothetical protein
MLRTVVGSSRRCSPLRSARRPSPRGALPGTRAALIGHHRPLDRDGRLMPTAGARAVAGSPATTPGRTQYSSTLTTTRSRLSPARAARRRAARGPVRDASARRDAPGPRSIKASSLLENRAVGGIVVGFAISGNGCRPRASREKRDNPHPGQEHPGKCCAAMPPYADEFVSEAVFKLTGHTAERSSGTTCLADPGRAPGAHRPRARRRASTASRS